MLLRPIDLRDDRNRAIYQNADCQNIFQIYQEYYKKIGFEPPWIGYFVLRENQVVGCCGFVGQPKDGVVEIAYGTFKTFEGQGVASFSCQSLIEISREAEPAVVITAKTAPCPNASTRILLRNHFRFDGVVQDDEIGDAWHWVYEGDLPQ